MTLQPITYRPRTMAAATRERFFLSDTLDQRPPSDPERTFVIFMCAYAGDVLNGILPLPYTDQDARRYARACLVAPELLERPMLDLQRAAALYTSPSTSCAPHEPSTRGRRSQQAGLGSSSLATCGVGAECRPSRRARWAADRLVSPRR